jgi:hypothetical protein
MRSEQISSAIVRKSDPRDRRINVIARGDCVAESFQNKQPCPLTNDQSIGIGA